jgi:hypothetical protein
MNYKEVAISGTEHFRSYEVKIDNKIGVTPSMYFSEEKVTTLSDGQILQKHADYLKVVYDPLAVITLIDPATDIPTGQTMTHEQFYAAIYSIYKPTAIARDLEYEAHLAALAVDEAIAAALAAEAAALAAATPPA